MVALDQRGLRVMEGFVFGDEVLLAAFALEASLDEFDVWDARFDRSQYAMVTRLALLVGEHPREEDFHEVIEFIRNDGVVTEILRDYSSANEKEWNQALEDLFRSEVRLTLGEPVNLGVVFERNNRAGHCVLMSAYVGEELVKVAAVTTVVLLDGQIYFLRLYAEYEGLPTIDWLVQRSDSWSGEFQQLNGR